MAAEKGGKTVKRFGSKVLLRYILSYLLLISILLLSAAFCFDSLNHRMSEIVTEGDRLALNRYKEAMDAQFSAMVRISEEFIVNDDVRAFCKVSPPLSGSDHYTAVQITSAIRSAMYRYPSSLVQETFLYFPMTDSVMTAYAHISAQLFFRSVFSLPEDTDYTTCFSRTSGAPFSALKDVDCRQVSTGQPMLVLYRPLKRAAGDVYCVIGFLLNPENLRTMLSDASEGKTTEVYLCRPDGSAMFSSREDEAMAALNAAVTVDSESYGVRYCLASSYTGLAAIADSARKDLYVIMGVGLLGSLALACVLAFSNYRPISALWQQVSAAEPKEQRLRNEIKDINSYIYRIVQANSQQSGRIQDMLMVYSGKVLADFVNGSLAEDEVNWAEMEECGILLDKPCFMVILLKINTPEDGPGDEQPSRYDIGMMALQVFGEWGVCLNVYQKENVLQYLLNIDSEEDVGQVKHAALILQQQLEQHKGVNVAFALGGVTDRSGVWQSTQQAQRTLQSVYMDQAVRVLSHDDLHQPLVQAEFSQDYEISLMNYLKGGNLQGLKQVLDDMFDASADCGAQAQLVMLHVLESCISVGPQMHVSFDRIYPYDDALLTHVMQFSSIAQFKAFILEMCGNMTDEQARRQKSDEALKRAVAAFVNEHYDDINLNVSMLADHLNVSQSFLSTHFKRQSGINASDYIHIVRIEKAKALMADTSLSLTQIAKSIGYISDATFIRSFKKYEGLTPGAYRKNFIHVESSVTRP